MDMCMYRICVRPTTTTLQTPGIKIEAATFVLPPDYMKLTDEFGVLALAGVVRHLA